MLAGSESTYGSGPGRRRERRGCALQTSEFEGSILARGGSSSAVQPHTLFYHGLGRGSQTKSTSPLPPRAPPHPPQFHSFRMGGDAPLHSFARHPHRRSRSRNSMPSVPAPSPASPPRIPTTTSTSATGTPSVAEPSGPSRESQTWPFPRSRFRICPPLTHSSFVSALSCRSSRH